VQSFPTCRTTKCPSHRLYISQLVDDGATLQSDSESAVSHPEVPRRQEDLGLHTQVITDGFLRCSRRK